MQFSLFSILLFGILLGVTRAQTSENVEDAKKNDGGDVETDVLKWKIMPGDKKVRINESLYIDCVAESSKDPPPVAVWTKDDKKIAVGNETTGNSVVQTNGTLTIENFQEVNIGDYTCAIGDLKKTVKIRAYKQVVLGELDDEVETFVGCNVSITCRAVGDCILEGFWRFGTKDIVSDSENFVIEQVPSPKKENEMCKDEMTLKIYHADEGKSGVYKCTYANTIGPDVTEEITIKVKANTENETCPNVNVAAVLPPDETVTKATNMQQHSVLLVYIVPAVIVGTLLLVAIVIAVALVVRKRRQQQNAVFSGVKYRRTEGNEDAIRA